MIGATRRACGGRRAAGGGVRYIAQERGGRAASLRLSARCREGAARPALPLAFLPLRLSGARRLDRCGCIGCSPPRFGVKGKISGSPRA
ncbi:hypothetical protein EVAR_68401_1 [Eumeta japonica]|uniref:Uncharacterized protein n=1 Tax=Eumeta variegata TaxID=151549 RepID=A0A4C2ACZ3_EUMVA|nr:hypothetical protein EVAR_68401_1 [Eumeta japonica]